MKHTLIIYLLIQTILSAIGSWSVNNRSHPELKWKTIKTENFDIHYHEGIREIALSGASIAEQVRPTLIKQMNLDSLPRLDIVFTSEDEVLNGFAMPSNNTIIWVDQNDAALWNGDEKWLRTVLAHELQHLVYFNTVKGPWWLPFPMGYFFNGVPSWFVEGIGEDFIPTNVDLDLLDDAVTVADSEAFEAVQKLLKEEGILAGSSSGTLISGAIKWCQKQTEPKKVVTFVCDTGNKYLSKAFNDNWMFDQGLSDRQLHGDLRDLVSRQPKDRAVITVGHKDTITTAHARMKMHSISQLPVTKEGEIVGVIDELDLLKFQSLIFVQ
mgnify:CR=1 FL=1